MKIKRALLSVTDKRGLAEFASGLSGMGVELLSTGGTANLLRQAGLPVKDVAEETGSPEMLDGRVKTIHPRIHGGILARRDDPAHVQQLKQNNITPIDLVCVNLYDFSKTIAIPECTLNLALENIDIGGPCLIRASAKNHAWVVVLTDPQDYGEVLAEMQGNGGQVSARARLRLAVKAFKLTYEYDRIIFSYLSQLPQ